ncbi:hypothetical protein [Acidisoma sp. 7E03]
MPDDLPIGPAAAESAGDAPPAAGNERKTRRGTPEGEVRGGGERVSDRPLEQLRREDREARTKPQRGG